MNFFDDDGKINPLYDKNALDNFNNRLYSVDDPIDRRSLDAFADAHDRFNKSALPYDNDEPYRDPFKKF